MPLISVDAPPGPAGPPRRQRLRPVQHLDLALLTDAQHDGAVGRVQIETNDIAGLLDKDRIAR